LQAPNLVQVHKYPFGDTTPSRADIDVTREIIGMYDPFEITVHDHLIAGPSRVTSFRTRA
jgi:DNA repair protein RadC